MAETVTTADTASANVETAEKAEVIVKEKRQKKKRNRPDLAHFGYENVKPGDNTRYLRFARIPMKLPPIDIRDPQQVADRIDEYFTACEENDMKPNMVGMANWIGVHRDTVNSWKNGERQSGSQVSDVINQALEILETLWVDYMQNGKVNPASGIFLGKNMFQYRDVRDVTVIPKNPLGEEPNADVIAAKYAELPDE